jgi:hypothetical protein
MSAPSLSARHRCFTSAGTWGPAAVISGAGGGGSFDGVSCNDAADGTAVGPVERNAVLSMPPPPVRVRCRYIWEPRYDARRPLSGQARP